MKPCETMIRPKKKPCDGINCNGELQYIWKTEGRQKYCKSCWIKKKAAQEPKVKPVEHKVMRTCIKPISVKMSKLLQGYRRLRKIFFNEPKNCVCKAKLPGCLGIATDIHHKKGHNIYFLDISTWLPVCRLCHKWIEEHPKEAKELGLSESRLTKKPYEETQIIFSLRDLTAPEELLLGTMDSKED